MSKSVIACILLSFLSIAITSCKNDRSSDLPLTKDTIQDTEPKIFKEADFYCVIDSSVLALKIMKGILKFNRKFELKFIFGYYYYFDENEIMADPNFKAMNQPGLEGTITYLNLYMHKEYFEVLDENNKVVDAALFNRNSSYYQIPYKPYHVRESRWRLDNWDAIVDWERSPIESFSKNVRYIDFNKKLCRLSSGYFAKIKKLPTFEFPFKQPIELSTTIPDTIVKLGYKKEIRKDASKFTLLDWSKKRKFDYICIEYDGLLTLMNDLNLKAIPSDYSMILYLVN